MKITYTVDGIKSFVPFTFEVKDKNLEEIKQIPLDELKKEIFKDNPFQGKTFEDITICF